MNEAIEAAALIGYPVVLKGCSPKLIHKTEQGCIELNLKSEQDVRAAFERIAASADVELDGILVQEMVSGQRELILGLKRDRQFGAVVMVGLGGVFAEIVKDTAFRVAPIDMVEAEDMINQLKSRDILDSFRGGEAADIGAVCKCLTALGTIGLERGVISEIDINPMIIRKNGRIVAVDALVILGSA